MPSGYGLATTERGLLPWSWALARIRKTRNCWLATVRPNKRPHVMPVWCVWYDGALYFSTGWKSRKARNLARNHNCVICFERGRDEVIVEGAARHVTSAALIRAVGRQYWAKYKFKLDPSLGPIFAVRPRKAFGFIETTRDFTRTATRWHFS